MDETDILVWLAVTDPDCKGKIRLLFHNGEGRLWVEPMWSLKTPSYLTIYNSKIQWKKSYTENSMKGLSPTAIRVWVIRLKTATTSLISWCASCRQMQNEPWGREVINSTSVSCTLVPVRIITTTHVCFLLQVHLHTSASNLFSSSLSIAFGVCHLPFASRMINFNVWWWCLHMRNEHHPGVLDFEKVRMNWQDFELSPFGERVSRFIMAWLSDRLSIHFLFPSWRCE